MVFVYDAEIIRGPVTKNDGDRIPGKGYASSWVAYEEMGVAVVAGIIVEEMRPIVFLDDNKREFADKISDCSIACGFNSKRFDIPLLEANGWVDGRVSALLKSKNYDVYRAIMEGAGLNPNGPPPSGFHYNLDAVASANGFGRKTMDGRMAPIYWQDGKIGRVVSYCLDDVWKTASLMRLILDGKPIIDPNTRESLEIEKPDFVSSMTQMDISWGTEDVPDI